MTGGPQSPSAATAASFAESLVAVGKNVEELLPSIASSRLDARRMVTQSFGLDPTAEVLHAIVKIACDKARDGTRRELPRRFLVLRILVDQELKQLLESRHAEVATIQRCNQTLKILLGAVHRVENEFRAILGDPEFGQAARDYLLQICDSLTPNREKMVSALLLAPRLELLVAGATDGTLQQAVPSLSDEDAAMIRHGLVGGPADDTAPSRVCINAIALRSIIDEDLANWQRIVEAGDDEQDEVEIARRVGAFEQLKLDKLSYDVVIDQLQQQQDLALKACLESFSEEVSRVRGDLFSSYIRLAPILRGASDEPMPFAETDDSTQHLLEQSTAAEVAAGELFIEALTSRDKPEQPSIEAGSSGAEPRRERNPAKTLTAAELRRKRTRVKALTAVAGVLLVACIVFFLTAPRPPAPIRVSTLEFSHIAPLTEVQPVGTMLYARVPDYYWHGLSDGERTQCISELGRQAVHSGFDVVYLVDDGGEPAASWDSDRGIQLTSTEN